MGMTSALKFRKIVENAEHILAIELISSAEGIEYRRPLKSSVRIEKAHELVRSVVPRLAEDRPPSTDIEALSKLIREGGLDEFLR